MSDRIPVEQCRFQQAKVADTAWIAPGSVVLGDVTIGERSSIWYQTVIRGDVEQIRVGDDTNVQDLCMLHADAGFPCILGNRVTVGHAAIVHGAIIEDDVMIGMRSVVMNGARIGRGSIVAVGAIVLEGTEIPPGSIAMGIPAKVKRIAEPRDQEKIRHAAEHYVAAAQSHREACQTNPARR